MHFSSVNPIYNNNGYALNSVYNHGGPRYAPNPGGLLLRCTAQIGDLYQEYKEIELGTPQKDPVPARGRFHTAVCRVSDSKLITQKYICFPFPFFNPSSRFLFHVFVCLLPAAVTLSSGSSMKNFFSTYFSTSAASAQRSGGVHLAHIAMALAVLLVSSTLLSQMDSLPTLSFIPAAGQLAVAHSKSSGNRPSTLPPQDTTAMTDLVSTEIISLGPRTGQKFSYSYCVCDGNSFNC